MFNKKNYIRHHETRINVKVARKIKEWSAPKLLVYAK